MNPDPPRRTEYDVVTSRGFIPDPDPLRPVDTDDPYKVENYESGGPGLDLVVVIALGVIVGILVAWAVR